MSKQICENDTVNSGIIESVSMKYYSNCKSTSQTVPQIVDGKVKVIVRVYMFESMILV